MPNATRTQFDIFLDIFRLTLAFDEPLSEQQFRIIASEMGITEDQGNEIARILSEEATSGEIKTQ